MVDVLSEIEVNAEAPNLDRKAGLHVDLFGPVHGHVFRGAEQRAVDAIEQSKAIAIEMRETFVPSAVPMLYDALSR